MSLNEIVTLTLTRSTVFPTRAGFGVLLLLAAHTLTGTTRSYTSKAGVDADFASTHPVNAMATKAFSQNPSPSRVLVGKRATGTTQIVTLTPKNLALGYTYAFTIVDYLGVSTAVSFTNGASETATTISTALAALVASVASVTPTSAALVTLTSTTAGRFFDLKDLPDLRDLAVKNTSTDPGVATALTAVYAADPSTWYGIVLDSNSKAEILAAATWTEATRKLLLVQSSDSEIADNAVSTDVASSLHAAAYARTAGIFAQNRLRGYRMVGLSAKMFTTVPGASTWEYQTIASDTVDTIDDGSLANIRAKFFATYTIEGGVNVTRNVVLSEGEPVDLAPGTDKLYARIQEAIFGLFYAKSQAGTKVPYTDPGTEEIKGTIATQLDVAIREGFLAEDPAPTVTGPKVATIDPAVKATRVYPGVKFGGTLAGAIQKVEIAGTLSV